MATSKQKTQTRKQQRRLKRNQTVSDRNLLEVFGTHEHNVERELDELELERRATDGRRIKKAG